MRYIADREKNPSSPTLFSLIDNLFLPFSFMFIISSDYLHFLVVLALSLWWWVSWLWSLSRSLKKAFVAPMTYCSNSTLCVDTIVQSRGSWFWVSYGIVHVSNDCEDEVWCLLGVTHSSASLLTVARSLEVGAFFFSWYLYGSSTTCKVYSLRVLSFLLLGSFVANCMTLMSL